jgi:hypothetical protein
MRGALLGTAALSAISHGANQVAGTLLHGALSSGLCISAR